MHSYADINLQAICIIFACCWHQFFSLSPAVGAFIRFIDAVSIYIYSQLSIRMETRKCICTIVRLGYLWNEVRLTTLYSRVFLLEGHKS